MSASVRQRVCVIMGIVSDADVSEVDLEPGASGVQVHIGRAEWVLVRCVVWFLCGVCVSGFVCEYWQEYANIRALKDAHIPTLWCVMSAEDTPFYMRWFSYYSGLDDAEARMCHEQRRVASLLPWPNPLVVLLNVIWRACIGDNTGEALARLLSHQSYVVQIALIVTTAAALAMLIYQLAANLPNIITTLLHMQQYARHMRYKHIQANLARTHTDAHTAHTTLHKHTTRNTILLPQY